MKKIKYKRILKDILTFLGIGYISVLVVFGAIVVEAAQFPLKYLITAMLIVAIVFYLLGAAFKGFKMGYIIKPEEAEGASIGPVVLSEEDKKDMFKNLDNLHQEEQEENP